MIDTGTRTLILERVRRALSDVPDHERPQDAPVPRDYLRSHSADDLIGLFAERVAAYQAEVFRAARAQAPDVIARLLGRQQITTLVVPPVFPQPLLARATGSAPLRDDPPLSVASLDAAHGVISTCALGIAATGTIVLDAGPGQGRRALTLLPDYHLCVIDADQIVSDVPSALSRLDPFRPLTLISGPSATSDIENDRVEGVHGPRTLHILIIEPDPEQRSGSAPS